MNSFLRGLLKWIIYLLESVFECVPLRQRVEIKSQAPQALDGYTKTMSTIGHIDK